MVTLNDLKVRCLKKIKMDNNTSLNSTNFDDYKNDTNYSKYINNMVDSINDGISRLVLNDNIPFKQKEITITTPKHDLSVEEITETNDIYKLQAILHEDYDGIQENVEYSKIGSKYMLGDKYSDGKFIVIYSPRIDPITEDTPGETDLASIGLDELSISYLTNFVKSELYESIEPELARLWRNYADTYQSAMTQEVEAPKQKRVKNVYRF